MLRMSLQDYIAETKAATKEDIEVTVRVLYLFPYLVEVAQEESRLLPCPFTCSKMAVLQEALHVVVHKLLQ